MRFVLVIALLAAVGAPQAHAEPPTAAPQQAVIATVVDRGDISARFVRPPIPALVTSADTEDAPAVVVGRLPQVPPAPPAPPELRVEAAPVQVVEVTRVIRERPVYSYRYRTYAHKPHKPHRPKYTRASRSWSWARGNRYLTERRWRDMARR